MAKSPTMVRIEDSLKKSAQAEAEREGRSLSNLIGVALQAYLNGKAKETPAAK